MTGKYFGASHTRNTKTLSEYAANLRYENILPEVIERVKLMTLHTLGVSLAAKPIDLTAKALECGLIMNGGEGGKATSWVGGHKLSAANASIVNGALAGILDWADCSLVGHPCAEIIPLEIAVAEESGANGKQYLEAVAAGLEVYLSTSMLMKIPKYFDKFHLMNILIKHWPADIWVQTPVEIVSELAQRYKINPDDIEEIIIDPPTQFRMNYYKEGFSSLKEAQFSMPYVIAAVLLEPKPGASWYTREMMLNPKLLEIAEKVIPGTSEEHTLQDSLNMYIDGTFPEKKVIISMKNGKNYMGIRSGYKGYPRDMLSREEFCEIFKNNALIALPSNKANDLIDYILNIEKQTDLSNFGLLFS